MAYPTNTRAIVNPLVEAINANWVRDQQTTFVKKHLVARISYAFLIPLTVMTSITDIAMGIVGSVAAVITGGSQPFVNMFGGRFLGAGSRTILAEPYRHLLRAIDPQVSINTQMPFRGHLIVYNSGLIAGRIQERLAELVQGARESNVFLTRHLATRGLHLLEIPICIVTRVADLAIGLIATAFSIVTLGQIHPINQIAYGGLLAPLMLQDLFKATVHAINPWAGF